MAQPAACCETCLFSIVDGNILLCRRNPPAVIPSRLQETRDPASGPMLVVTEWRAAFPPMSPTAWCGEHKFKMTTVN